MEDPWIEGFWQQMLAMLQDDIKKHKKQGKLGESPTIKCLKSLKEFKKTIHEQDDEKVFFSIEDDILEEIEDVLGSEQQISKRVREQYFQLTKQILEGAAYEGRTTINKAEVNTLFRAVGKKMEIKLKFGDEQDAEFETDKSALGSERRNTQLQQLLTPREQGQLDLRVTARLAESLTKPKKMKESTLSIISYIFIDKPQKKLMQRIYKYMDKSDDGALDASEIQNGIKAILANLEDAELQEHLGLNKAQVENNDDWCKQIIENAEIDGDGKLDFNDFMLASIDLSE